MTSMAVELAQFKIDPATESAMMAARVEAMNEIRSNCAGMRESRLFRGQGEGEWFDLIFWDSLD